MNDKPIQSPLMLNELPKRKVIRLTRSQYTKLVLWCNTNKELLPDLTYQDAQLRIIKDLQLPDLDVRQVKQLYRELGIQPKAKPKKYREAKAISTRSSSNKIAQLADYVANLYDMIGAMVPVGLNTLLAAEHRLKDKAGKVEGVEVK